MSQRRTADSSKSRLRLRNPLVVPDMPYFARRRRGRTGPAVALGATAVLVGGTLLVPTAAEVYRTLADAGPGPGHGRGLSQHGAAHFADTGQTAEEILAYYYPGAELGSVGPASVSVRLQGQDGADLAVYSDAGARVAGRELGPGEAAHLTPTPGGGAEVVVTDGCDGAVRWETTTEDPWVYPLDPNPGRPAEEHLTLCEGRAYRGSLGIAAENGDPRTVNRVDVEDYLLGVVPAEMPPNWAPAALEAQAIAARSYALAESRTDYAQTCDTTDCQMYVGTEQEEPNTAAAIAATAGRVLLRDGRILRSEYSSAPDGGKPGDVEAMEVGPTPEELGTATPDGNAPRIEANGPNGLDDTSPWQSTPRTPRSPGGAVGSTPIDLAWAELGGNSSIVGPPVGPELPLPRKLGSYRIYENGVIFHSPDLGTQVVDFTTILELIPDLGSELGSSESGSAGSGSADSRSDLGTGSAESGSGATGSQRPGSTESRSRHRFRIEAGRPAPAPAEVAPAVPEPTPDSGGTAPAPEAPLPPAAPAPEADQPVGSDAIEGDNPQPVPGAPTIPTDIQVTN